MTNIISAILKQMSQKTWNKEEQYTASQKLAPGYAGTPETLGAASFVHRYTSIPVNKRYLERELNHKP